MLLGGDFGVEDVVALLAERRLEIRADGDGIENVDLRVRRLTRVPRCVIAFGWVALCPR
jgi:hypothetical protein